MRQVLHSQLWEAFVLSRWTWRLSFIDPLCFSLVMNEKLQRRCSAWTNKHLCLTVSSVLWIQLNLGLLHSHATLYPWDMTGIHKRVWMELLSPERIITTLRGLITDRWQDCQSLIDSQTSKTNTVCKRPWWLSRSLEGLTKVINMQKNMQIKNPSVLFC